MRNLQRCSLHAAVLKNLEQVGSTGCTGNWLVTHLNYLTELSGRNYWILHLNKGDKIRKHYNIWPERWTIMLPMRFSTPSTVLLLFEAVLPATCLWKPHWGMPLPARKCLTLQKTTTRAEERHGGCSFGKVSTALLFSRGFSSCWLMESCCCSGIWNYLLCLLHCFSHKSRVCHHLCLLANILSMQSPAFLSSGKSEACYFSSRY